jgi:hypothetical protein
MSKHLSQVWHNTKQTGDGVEKRQNFIREHALEVQNLNV